MKGGKERGEKRKEDPGPPPQHCLPSLLTQIIPSWPFQPRSDPPVEELGVYSQATLSSSVNAVSDQLFLNRFSLSSPSIVAFW